MSKPSNTLIVRRAFVRPAPDSWHFLQSASTCLVSDALGKAGTLPSRVRPITKANRFCGPALTVRCFPRDNFAPWTALTVAQTGDILILATAGSEDAAVMGDHFAAMARKFGISGVATDGLVRDIGGIDATGLPVFAAGITPLSAPKSGNVEVGFNIAVGGCVVHPGDIVCGDENGVVVVPSASLDTFRTTFERIAKEEAARDAAALSDDRSLPEWLTEALNGSNVINC